MKHISSGLLGVLAIAAATPVAAQDCNLTFAVEYDCYAADLGWALATDIESAITPYDYLWSTGATTQYVDGLPNGEHWVMITDAAGCSHKIDFSLDCSKDEEPDEPCQLRTQTQGGWGTGANGNNPGVYRDANFAGAFPGGLVIGCDHTLTLTSSAAVQAFLPSGTTPKALTTSYVDPGNSYKNVLAGQLVALTLSVGFDLYDEDFGTGGLLADAVINNGTFQGWTVAELLDEANSFIGGCGSSYTASQLNSALSMVNENFVDGTMNNGNLDCAGGKKEEKLLMGEAVTLLGVHPNPASDVLVVRLASNIAGEVGISMIDALGRTITTATTTEMAAGEDRTITLDVNDLQNGSYFLTVHRNGQVMQVQRFVVAH